MCSNRLLTQGWAATILLSFCFVVPASGSEDCADVPPERVIEKIPPTEIEGTTCIDPGDDVVNLQSYATVGSKNKCPLAGVSYPAHDVIYKVKLNKGNEVAFLLTPLAENGEEPPPGSTTPDLVLALITACDDGQSCVSSSPDFIGTGKEQIPAATYEEGIYYLVVDSFYAKEGSCGKYRLKVTGVNPTPDLSLEVKADSKRAVAGEDLVYTLTISNSGDAEAQGVKLTLTLPPGVIHNDKNVVEWDDISIPPRKDKTTPGTWTTDLKADVGQHLEGKMITSARAEIKGYPPAQDSLTTTVDHKHDLSVELTASTMEVVAGNPRKYTLTLHNDGPSDATNVTATLSLDSSKEDLISNDCPLEGGQFVCDVGTLQADSPEESRTFHFEVELKSSATGSILHEAKIDTATGTDPLPKDNRDSLDDMVSRDTDLVVDSITVQGTGLEQTKDTVTVAAGADFTYVIGITNAGPSDSSGGTVTIRGLPGYLKSFSSESGCTKSPQEDGPFVVTCETSKKIVGKGGRDTVKFSLRTLSDLGERTFHATAEVASQEEPANIKDKEFDTNIVVQADLQFKTPPTAPASGCGGDILYTMEVINKGPSNSTAGKVTAELDGLSFLSSPNDCKPESGADNKITCSVGDLPVDDPNNPNNPSPSKIQFWASPTKLGVVTNQLSLQGERDPDAKVVTDLSTTLSPTADLEVTLTASVNPLTPGQFFTYDVAVTNHGPLKAFNVQVEVVTDPPGLLSPPNVLDFGDIAAGSLPEIRKINARAPQESGVIITTATLQPRVCDPNSPPNNVAKLTTTVAKEGDADLSLTMTAGKEAVSLDDVLMFTLQVLNQGPATAEEVKVQVTLPEGLCIELEDTCERTFSDTVGVLEAGEERPPTSFAAKVTADGPILETEATVLSKQNDPNASNNEPTVFTQRAARLVVPFVEVNADGDAAVAHPTTIFTLKNPSETSDLDVSYNVFFTDPLTGRSDDPIPGSLTDLPAKAMATVDLLGLDELSDQGLMTGHVEISPEDASASGDFTLVDSEEGTATGERLISTATDLCNRWSVRFLNDRPLGSSTELLFFIPDNPGGEIATGRVFSESGRFVSDIKAKFTQESYRFTDVPKGSGSIEWTFAPGLVGSITAIHTFNSSDEVAVPGFCRDHAGAKTIILPFFQVDGAINTYVAIRNETNGSVQAELTYLYDDEGEEKTQKKEITLAGHAVWTEGLRGALSDKTEELPSSKTGFLKIEAFEPQEDDEEKTAASALSGDFIRVGPGGLAGSTLVEKLCTKWDVRFKPGTSFLFYLDQSGSPEGKVYKENGTYVDMVSTGDQPAQSFLVSAPNLEQVSSGSVEWNLGVPGYVAMLLSGEGGQSVLIPGACLPEEEAPED